MPPSSSPSEEGALNVREREIAEAAYQCGFWDGVRALQDVDVFMDEDWQRHAQNAAEPGH